MCFLLKRGYFLGKIIYNKPKGIIMSNFFQTVFSNIGIADILDIVVVAFIVYKVLEFIRETRHS